MHSGVLITYVDQNARFKKCNYLKSAFLFALFVTLKNEDVL
jgi:hypothetical protein